ncbi:MAG: hypothetical protein ACI9XB_004505, partial [Gammaproteobacteria bacterium]
FHDQWSHKTETEEAMTSSSLKNEPLTLY